MDSKYTINKRREELSSAKKELLTRRLHPLISKMDNWQVIPKRAQESTIPLSFAQQRLWFLQQLEPENPMYNETMALRLTGPLKRNILQQVLDTLSRHHEILRTTFTLTDGSVEQIVHAPGSLDTAFVPIDLQLLPDEQRQTAAFDWMHRQAQQAFSMVDTRLWQTFLLLLYPQEYILFIKMHHILCDSYSIGILLQEISTMYFKLSQGAFVPLQRPMVQYADYTLWQHQYLAGNTLETLLAHWKHHLAGAPMLLELPTDYPRQLKQPNLERSLHFQFSAAQVRQLHLSSQQEGITLFMLLLTSLAITLTRQSDQDDIVIGTSVSGRTSPYLAETFGLFVNILPLRLRLAGNPTLHQLLQQARNVTLEAYAHQDIPFEKLVEEMHVQRVTGQNPLFQVVLDLQPASLRQGVEIIKEIDGVGILPMPTTRSGHTKFDLTLMISEHEKELSGEFIYNSGLWEESSIQRLLAYWQHILQALLTTPERRLSEISLFNATERNVLLARWSKTQQPLCPLSITELFEHQVSSTPEHIALVFEDTSLTYLELNQRANQLAHHLYETGIAPETPIGVYMERSPELIIALLALLKAGGSYVPLDPLYPIERLNFFLQDCDAPILLTQERFCTHFPDYQGVVLPIDTASFRQSPWFNNLLWKPDQQQLAYIIYTSGTTGKPKGVCVTHQALANHLLNMQQAFAVQPEDCVLQFASPVFDVSLEQILTPLISGATLLLKDTTLWHTRDLLRHISAQAPTIINLPTAYWYQWLQDIPALKQHDILPPTLKLVVVGGDKILPEAIRLWFQLLLTHWPRLLNAYGPTEATITTSVFSISHPPESHTQLISMSIGSPLPNRTYYVLDKYGEPTPPGTRGELYIGGALLARGYLRRPDLTAERFVPNPFSATPGAFLYRTGDIVRAHAHDTLEVLGRTDWQVKIRGFRLELGEIEAVLVEYPPIREAVVVAKEDASGENYLVAYITGMPDTIPEVMTIQHYLQARLPHYMLPTHFVILDALPLAPNGKLDRRALPTSSLSGLQNPYSAPQTTLEIALAALWSNLLSVPHIGRHDNFFTLGGHSLLSMQLVSRIQQTLQIELPLRAIFDYPTLASLAAHLLHYVGTRFIASASPFIASASPFIASSPPFIASAPLVDPILETIVTQEEQQDVLPASFHQKRLWFLDQLQPHQEQYNLSIAVRIEGQLDVSLLERCLNEIVNRHESLRTIFLSQEEPQQVILPTLAMKINRQDLRHYDQQTQALQAQTILHTEANIPFQLAEGPLLRALLLQIQEHECIFLLTMHHIISDGWSIGILFNELFALYAAFSQQKPSPFAPLGIQYRHYTQWQRAWLQGDRLNAQLAYWRHQLHNAPPLIALPTDYPRPAIPTLTGSQQSISLSQQIVDQLHTLSQSEHATLSMTLLAALNLFLYRVSGQADIIIGIPHLGRPRPEFEPLIGLFANMLPLRTSLAGAPTFRQLIQRVQKVALEAYAHADIPFEQLVQALHIEPDLSYHPLFQVEFGLQKEIFDISDLRQKSASLLNLSLHGIQLHMNKVKLDLACFITESEQGLAVTLEYSSDLFADTTITRLLGYIHTLITDIVLHPDQPITRLSLLSTSERQQILTNWNARSTHAFPKTSFYQAFVSQTVLTPDILAVVCTDQQLTYRELIQRSEQLASVLTTYGIGPEALVALVAERNSNFLITLLALFRLGAAYLPVDPYAPSQRQRVLLQESRTSLIIASSSLMTSLSSELKQPIAALEALLAQAANLPEDTHLPYYYDPHQLAYVIYTSGSTGMPKGAMIEQQGMLNHLYAKIKDLDLSEHDIIAQTASQCFDISVWQFLAPLLVGGCVHIFSDEIARDPVQLLQYIKQDDITVFETVPSLFRIMLAEITHQPERQALLPALRWLLLTGEALPPDLCLQWQHYSPTIRLMNTYGPTECSDDVTHYALPAILPKTLYSVPIGYPVANTQIYILDPDMQPAPIGIPGELYCAGSGVGRGYLYHAGLTAERFLPHPFSDMPGARLYKTGDIARYLPDGTIEYQGRRDQQIKIRGVRIEPGEIEGIIRQQQAVREVIVMSRKFEDNNIYLAAYIVPQHQFDIDILIQTLKGYLPTHMFPERFVVLPALPLNANGKIDYAALPEPKQVQSKEDIFIAPRSATEQVIARMWAEVLALDPAQISVHANFFSLGGHSLLAAQVAARLRRVFRVDLSLRSFFEHPTIAEFAHFLATSTPNPEQIAKIARIFQSIDLMNKAEISQLLEHKKRII